MVDPVGTGVVSAFGTLLKGLQTIKDLAVSVEIKAKVTELYDVILSGQQSALESNIKQQALLDTIGQLKEEIARVKAWEETKKRYSLYEPTAGTFVYVIKEESKGEEPSHWICANCYNEGKRSILQLKTVGVENNHYLCPLCKTEFKVRGTRPMQNVQVNRGPRNPNSWMA